MAARLVAEQDADAPRFVVANDPRRLSFSMVAGGKLHAISGADLTTLHTWPLDDVSSGWHATSPDQGVALVSGVQRVSLLEGDGAMRWSYRHIPWSGSRESGCTWFDEGGRPFAIIPGADKETCRIVHFDLVTGRPVAEATVIAEPAGIDPIQQPGGWVGLSEGEGQDAAKAWWVRVADKSGGRLDLLDAGWDDQVLVDVNSAGTRIITTPHGGVGRPLTVRSFPELAVIREVPPPGPDQPWDFVACFVGSNLVGNLLGDEEQTVAIDPTGRIEPLDVGEGWLVPAADSWLTVERTRIRK